MQQLDRDRFPRMAAYLDALPKGIDSYPDAQAKGSIFRTLLTSRPLALAGLPQTSLPEPIAALARELPLPNEWIPEVWLMCVSLGIADAYELEDEEYLSWVYETNRDLFRGAYRLLMSLASPELLLRGATLRWMYFHRGTELLTEPAGPGQGNLILSFPHRLFAGLALRHFTAVFGAPLKLCVAHALVELERVGDEQAVFRCRWGAAALAAASEGARPQSPRADAGAPGIPP
jgi:hypothetical protein